MMGSNMLCDTTMHVTSLLQTTLGSHCALPSRDQCRGVWLCAGYIITSCASGGSSAGDPCGWSCKCCTGAQRGPGAGHTGHLCNKPGAEETRDMARCSCSLLTLALLLALALDPASARRRRMLVRRKVASVPAPNTTQPSGGRQPRPGRVVRRRLVPASPAPQLLAPAPPLPQHKPFTVNQTVAAKPDAVKRCEQCWNILIIYVMTVALLQSCPCSPSCPGSRAPAPPPPAPTAPATPATSAPASAAQPQVRRGITLANSTNK